MTEHDLFSWINQCDNLPPECYNGDWACTCESFIVPFLTLLSVGITAGILFLIRIIDFDERVKK